jgi:hypothetical protein
VVANPTLLNGNLDLPQGWLTEGTVDFTNGAAILRLAKPAGTPSPSIPAKVQRAPSKTRTGRASRLEQVQL